MRSPSQMDILQIDIHNKCHLACSNCTRLIAHQSKKWEMDLATFERAVKSFEGWYAPGKVLGIIAGEPTLHSQFEQLSRRFAELFGGQTSKKGRKPIKDFNAYAQERLFDRTSGRGLWTSLGARFYEHMEVIHEVYDHWNTNTHEANGLHQALLIHRDDYCEQTGTTQQQWEQARDGCWVQNLWSASVNDKGAYYCEVAASIDRTLYDGKHAWPIEKGWWQRSPADFKDQLHLCNHCSLAQRGPSQVDSLERDIVSEKNRIALSVIGSPAIRKERFDLYDASVHTEQRQVTTKDNYVKDFRVAPDHDSVLPKKLTAIVTSVGRDDHLKKTLAHNAQLVDELIIVTNAESLQSTNLTEHEQKIKAHFVLSSRCFNDDKVRFVLSSRCFDGDEAFNKGKIINDALKTVQNPDWILLTDADVFLNPALMQFIKSRTLNPGVLYGTTRLNAKQETIDHYGIKEIFVNRSIREVGHCVDSEPNGYFQLFNRRALAIRDKWPNVMCESFCSAGGIDSWLLQQWPKSKRVQIPEIPVVHIAHSDHLGEKWSGNKRPNTWRQCGMLTPMGGYVPTEDIPDGPIRLRLTETQNGKSVECEILGYQFPTTIVSPHPEGGLIFCGKRLLAHIHVAYFFTGNKS